MGDGSGLRLLTGTSAAMTAMLLPCCRSASVTWCSASAARRLRSEFRALSALRRGDYQVEDSKLAGRHSPAVAASVHRPMAPLTHKGTLASHGNRSRSLRLDARRPDYLGPLLGFVDDKFPELGG
jgi:hypothetical protein